MKKQLFYLALILLTHVSCSKKIDALIKFNNGKELRGVFKSGGNKLKLLENGKKYHIKDMKEITYFYDNYNVKYDIIDVKIYTDSKKSDRILAYKVFDGNKINLYTTTESYQTGGSIGANFQGTINKAYIQKKGEQFAYDISYIHAIQHKGVKARLLEYFKDCPALIEKIKSKEINRHNALKIAQFFEVSCN